MKGAHLGPKGQVVVPKTLRNALGIRLGDSLMVEARNGTVVLTPIVHRTVHDLRGVLRAPAPIDLAAARKVYQDHLVDKWTGAGRDDG